MNFKDDQALFALVAEYESLSEQGEMIIFDEKSYLLLIDYYEREQLWINALEVVDHALKTHSFSSEFYYRKAHLLINGNKAEAALDVLETAAIYAPSQTEIQLLKAKALVGLGLLEEALAILDDQKINASGSSLSDIYYLEARVFEKEEQFERMFYSLQSSLKENPGNPDALERLWLCVEMTKKYEESVQLHERILDENAYSYMAWYNLGHAHAYLGNYIDAIEAYEYAFVINEQFEFAYRECAELCFELKRFHQALKCYEELLEHFEPDSDLYLKIGQCHQELGSYKLARSFYLHAAQHDPLNDQAYFQLGECFALEGNWKSARHYFDKAIQIDDHQEEYFAALAAANWALDDCETALSCFEESIKLAPEQARYWIQFATFLIELDQSNAALELLEEAGKYTAGPELTFARVACLFASGKRQEAYFWLGEALTEDIEQYPLIFEMVPALEEDTAVHAMIATYLDE